MYKRQIEFSKGEAAPGQHEINLRYSDALEMADNHTVFKNGVKEIAHLEGESATFMAKPFAEQPGSSCHIHTSLWSPDGDTPLSGGDAGDGMSADMRAFVAGLQTHLADLTLLGAPNLNSYKRYQPESWAPTATVWALDNRTAGLRRVFFGTRREVAADEVTLAQEEPQHVVGTVEELDALLAKLRAGFTP